MNDHCRKIQSPKRVTTSFGDRMNGRKTDKRKVLIVTYHFPPFGGVKVQRALKFARYLPGFGWKPIIVTVKNYERYLLDKELLRQVPEDVQVIRTFSLEPTKIFKFLRSWYDRTRHLWGEAKKRDGSIDFESIPRHSWAAKFDSFIFMPDNKIGWLPFTIVSLLQHIKKNDFDVILSTSPPFTAHLLGFILKHIFRKPWIVDFRDLWLLNPWKKPATKFHLNLSRYIEHRVLKCADKVITVSDQLAEDLKSNYSCGGKKKFVTIPNGYDRNDFNIQNTRRTRKFSIGYVGTLYLSYAGRSPYYFLTALGRLKNQIPNLDSEMEVTFVGDIDKQNGKIIREAVSRFSLENVVNCIAPVPHKKAIAYMHSFDVLLLIVGKAHRGCPSSKGCLSGKLFEYLASQKPILALVEEGPVSELIRVCRSGVVVEPENVGKIEEAISSCYEAYMREELRIQPDMQTIAGFERRALTRRLADLLNELTENKTGG